MQSEAGAAGAVHGALQGGSLATTFTASQGLLLMLPDMFKIAGELQPCVFHVAARAVAGHALSIFGDHSDVYAARPTGFAILASASVQEAQDMAALAFMTTSREPRAVPALLRRLPHLARDQRDRRALGRRPARAGRRGAGGGAEAAGALARPSRACAARPRTRTSSSRRARRRAPFYAAVPRLLEEAMLRFARRTGRSYQPFEYVGDPRAERVVVAMGSATATIEAAVRRLNAEGEARRPRQGSSLPALLEPSPGRRAALLDPRGGRARSGQGLRRGGGAAVRGRRLGAARGGAAAGDR